MHNNKHTTHQITATLQARAVDDDGKVLIQTKTGDDIKNVTLNDLVKSYQLEGHLNNKSMELSEQRKALDAERQEFKTQSDAKLSTQEDYIRISAAQLTHEYNNVDWAALERENPTQFNLARTKFADRKAQIEQAIRVVQSERQLKAEQEAEQKRDNLVEEQSKLLTKLPQWKDPDVYGKESKAVAEGLIDLYGFSPDEAGSVTDHRHILIARDALAYRKLQESKPAIVKKVRKAAKVAKQRAVASESSQETNLRAIEARIKKTGGQTGDVAKYLLEKGIV